MNATEVVSAPGSAAATATKLKVGELKANGYVRAREFKNAKEAMELLNYIDFLAMNNAINVDDLELPIEETKDQTWKLDRAEINALFFGHAEKKKEQEAKDTVLPPDDVKKAISNLAKSRKENAIARYKATVQARMDDFNSYWLNCEQMIAQAKAAQDSINQLEGVDNSEKMLQNILDTLKVTNWNFLQFDRTHNFIKFVNRSDLILRYIVPQSGIRYETNCGKLLVTINLNNMEVRVAGFERAMPSSIGRYIHPHVSGNTVCWGNAAATQRDAAIAGDIATILKLLDSLLQNYNEASPYIRIDEFDRQIKMKEEQERRAYGKAQQAAQARTTEDEFFDEDVFDDEPEFVD